MSYHGNMKKMPFLFALLFLLTSCNQQTYSFKEVTGFEASDITHMQVSTSVYQSFAWVVDKKYHFSNYHLYIIYICHEHVLHKTC